jgi:hypothetical protein
MGLKTGEGRKEHAPAASIASRVAAPLWAGQVVQDHHVARAERRDEHLLDVGQEPGPVIGPSSTMGAVMPVKRRAPTEVVVFQCPCGDTGAQPLALGARP